MAIVKVIELGKATVEVAFEGYSASLSEVSRQSGVDFGGAKVNGREINMDHVVYDGDRIFLGAKKIKGNTDSINVKIIQFGVSGGNTDVNVEPGTTIEAAARMLNVNISGVELRLNGAMTAVEPSTELYSDSRIILGKKVKGNIGVDIKFVQFGAAGGGVTNVTVEEGTTLSSAASTARVNLTGLEVRANGSQTVVSGDYRIKSTDSRFILAKKVKGNN